MPTILINANVAPAGNALGQNLDDTLRQELNSIVAKLLNKSESVIIQKSHLIH